MTDSHQPHSTDSRGDLVEAARTDRTAFGELFDQFYPLVFAYCSRRLVVRAVAEDIASEIFLKVAVGIREFPGLCVEDFRRWLFRIATNEINAHLRQTVRRRELLEAAARMGKINATVSTSLLDSQTLVEWKDLYKALNNLSEREQTIISLRFFAGLKHEQIAEVLEVKSGTVRVALSRSLDKLRDRLLESTTPQRPAAGSSGGGHRNA
ncbi:MAG: RNA polymerase sigma factor [Planctomycetaceae bacterium]|nr:RNA polymerase sigma factor [Planctomycetales bacterium]MCB9921210.1 RNA polymerase sigma factor [Planctomycetaceae bacterium]